jgi:hypothetical protein
MNFEEEQIRYRKTGLTLKRFREETKDLSPETPLSLEFFSCCGHGEGEYCYCGEEEKPISNIYVRSDRVTLR